MLCKIQHLLVLLVGVAGLTLVLGEPRPITESCTKMGQDPCRCQTESGQVIDLTPLDTGNYLEPMYMCRPGSGGPGYNVWYGNYLQPKFKDVPVSPNFTTSTDLFSWNPCTPFCEMHCEGAATCQNVSKAEGLYYTIGKHDTADFTNNLTTPFYNTTTILLLTYRFQQYYPLGLTRTSVLRLFCDEDATEDKFIPYGEIENKTMFYYFDVISKHACPQNETGTTVAPTNTTTPAPTPHPCPHPWTTTPHTVTVPQTTTLPETTTTAAPSLWDLDWRLWVAIGCLSVVVLALVYFVIGLSVNLIRGRRGIAVVPHYLCWISMCSCCKCCGDCGKRENRRRLLKEYSDDIS